MFYEMDAQASGADAGCFLPAEAASSLASPKGKRS
jgi:hypothetical protein